MKLPLTKDEDFMNRALQVARLGQGFVSPNPMVGAVVVNGGKVIGEGWHQHYGGSHAEVNAIESIKDKTLLRGSTAYVNLEPCSHTGKTPPCSELLIRKEIGRVVISNKDPNPLVSGKGIKELREAGIEVTEGVLEKAGRILNKRFFSFHSRNRPYVILKWAQTQDGFIARPDFSSKWISSEKSRKIVHRWRAEEDAILVGANTVIYDNPSLTVRDWDGKNPKRIILDPNGKLDISDGYQIFNDDGETLVLLGSGAFLNPEAKMVSKKLVGKEDFPILVMAELHAMGVSSVLVEGGSFTINSFLDSNVWDEVRVFISKTEFMAGINAPVFDLGRPHESNRIGSDILKTYYNESYTDA